MEEKRTKIYINLIMITLLSKVIGFARESVLAYCFGTNEWVDAFKISESLAGVILGGLASISTIFVPIYLNKKNRDGILIKGIDWAHFLQ